MNIEGTVLLNQFIEYSCKPYIVITILIISGIIALASILLIEADHPVGITILIFDIVLALISGSIAAEEEKKTFLNYPAYTHYIIQIDDKSAWAEIASNYIIVKKIYPDTNIYEIQREYKEGDEQ